MPRVFIGLGSNIEDRVLNVSRAIYQITQIPNTFLKGISSIYQTAPVGMTEQEDFLNAVVEIETAATPERLLELLQEIERRQGRIRKVKWGPRTIDLDILSFEGRAIKRRHLQIPHLEMRNRRFVLVPFAEIAADYVAFGLNKTIKQLLIECSDKSKVDIYLTHVEVRNKLEEVAAWEHQNTFASKE
jgi:2-amino-4-hydroxy-6-hydroxymethyldihydropteridine diphosphokinase